MPSKLRGVTQAMDLLRFNLENDAGKLMDRVSSVDARRESVFEDAHRELDQHSCDLSEIDTFLGDLQGGNGGPSLKGSSGSSGQGQGGGAGALSSPPDPPKVDSDVRVTDTVAATAPEKPAEETATPAVLPQVSPVTTEPERLTINGVQTGS
jgi:hypothetical protein